MSLIDSQYFMFGAISRSSDVVNAKCSADAPAHGEGRDAELLGQRRMKEKETYSKVRVSDHDRTWYLACLESKSFGFEVSFVESLNKTMLSWSSQQPYPLHHRLLTGW
jgi:hypothetical protein